MSDLALAGLEMFRNQIINSDAETVARSLPPRSVDCVVTSPPYFGLRDYGSAGQIGQEASPEAYVKALVGVLRVVRRALKDTGTLWLNLGDSYATHASGVAADPFAKTTISGAGRNAAVARLASQNKAYRANVPDKNLLMIPHRVALALQADGWIVRSDIVWHKPNSMPESVTDRPTKAHEYVFLLSKQGRYWYDAAAIKTPVAESSIARARYGVGEGHKFITGAPGQREQTINRARPNGQRDVAELANARSVWSIPTKGYGAGHFALMPLTLAERCIMAGCPAGGLVFDPFMGAGTTALAAMRLGRDYTGAEINPEYVRMAEERLAKADPFQAHVAGEGILQLSLFG